MIVTDYDELKSVLLNAITTDTPLRSVELNSALLVIRELEAEVVQLKQKLDTAHSMIDELTDDE